VTDHGDRVGSPSGATLAAFLGAAIIGGANFVAVRFSNDELPPQFGAALRFAAAALLLFGYAAVRRIEIPRGRAAVGALIWGALGFGLAYGLLYYALVGLPAGATSGVVAAVPLVTLPLAVAHRQEQFTTRGLIGGLLALAGIAVLSRHSLAGEVRPAYVIAALVGVVAIAESSVAIKAFPRAHPIATNAIGMGTGAVLLAIASLAFGETWTVPETTETWLVLAWLVLVGSIGLFGLFLFVITSWTASASVYALALMPVVAVTLGTLIADETVTVDVVVGSALVITAVFIGALGTSAGAKEAAALPEAAGAEG
jgi:drug/metabolite transporter (DMT)-like permease